tara:strand:- start:3137 stop:3313 length:177 start_codon:yes stop_codon:yes gene_type:complete
MKKGDRVIVKAKDSQETEYQYEGIILKFTSKTEVEILNDALDIWTELINNISLINKAK